MIESALSPISAATVGFESSSPATRNNFGDGTDQSIPEALGTKVDDFKTQIVQHVQEIEADEADELQTPQFDLNATHIKASPYSDPLNFLNLTELDQSERLFALALTQLQDTRGDYATAPYMSSFNWADVFSTLRDLCTLAGITWRRSDFYVVIFRSRLQAGADRVKLGELDQMSHQEACASGGLLMYWFGTCDAERRNLATCIWRNREDAAAGGKGPWHRKARGAAREMYETISFHTHKLVIEDGAHTWHLEEFHG